MKHPTHRRTGGAELADLPDLPDLPRYKVYQAVLTQPLVGDQSRYTEVEKIMMIEPKLRESDLRIWSRASLPQSHWSHNRTAEALTHLIDTYLCTDVTLNDKSWEGNHSWFGFTCARSWTSSTAELTLFRLPKQKIASVIAIMGSQNGVTVSVPHYNKRFVVINFEYDTTTLYSVLYELLKHNLICHHRYLYDEWRWWSHPSHEEFMAGIRQLYLLYINSILRSKGQVHDVDLSEWKRSVQQQHVVGLYHM